MKEQDIIKAVAELDGILQCQRHIEHNLSLQNTVKLREWIYAEQDPDGVDRFRNEPPAYLTSRDAIIPVIEKQIFDIKIKIAFQFADFHDQTKALISILSATPPQLCEALLRATGKWVE